MQELREYVTNHIERGECTCGLCSDAGNPEDQPAGHIVDIIFFKCKAVNEPDADRLKELIAQSFEGDFGNCRPLDGKEHNYMELGGWIGDQGLAMMFMALCVLIGLAKLLSPLTMLPAGTPEHLVMNMAQAGMLSIQANKTGKADK